MSEIWGTCHLGNIPDARSFLEEQQGGFYRLMTPEQQKRAEQAVDTFKTGTLLEAAAIGSRPGWMSVKAENPEAVVASIVVERPGHQESASLWELRTEKLRPAFQKPFARGEMGLVRNIFHVNKKTVQQYLESIKMDRDSALARLQQKAGDERGQERVKQRLGELEEDKGMLEALNSIPGFYDLTEKLLNAKDAETRKKIERQIEAALS